MSLLLATALVGCGDPGDGITSVIPRAPSPEPARAALTLELFPTTGAQCPWARNVAVPTRPSYNFYDLERRYRPLALDGDGEHKVDCSVSSLAEPPGAYRVELGLQSGELGELRAEGTLTEGATSSLKVQLSDGLEQTDCEVPRPTLMPAAVLLPSVDCRQLTNPNVPEAACSAQLTLLFERCESSSQGVAP